MSSVEGVKVLDKELQFKLASEIDHCDWSMLKPHHQRGALWLVKGPNLLDVAMAMAQDQVEQIKQWRDNHLIAPPTKAEIAEWEKGPYKKLGVFLIVSPYVVVQIQEGDFE